ncbi:MAG: type II toxin-antitoxin system RelE/ParE family toxin [Phycisphaeraceae bacterium]
MVQVIWPAEAKRWLQEVYAFIAEHDPEAAERTVRGILSKAERLGRFPQMGQVYRDSDFGGDIRVLVHGHYRIIYLVEPEAVRILGVFHGRMDVPRHLKRQT